MLLTKEVEVKPNGKMIQYYKDLGYDAKYNQPMMVRIEDLSKGSEKIVEVLCDHCKETICHPAYKDYCKRIEKFGNYTCYNCRSIHHKETCMRNFGVDSPAKSEEVRKRMLETCLERYGTKNPLQNDKIKEKYMESIYQKYGVYNISQSVEIQQKREQTFIERYNTTNPFANESIKEKITHTLMTKYGVTNPLQIPEAKEKAKQTFIDNYGVDHPNKSSIVRSKTAQTLYKNGTTPTSKQQLCLFNIYKSLDETVCLNYPIAYYNADICLPNEKIDIEYDGGFHNGQVKLGKLTQEEFDKKEIIRNNIIKREGYKQMRIVSRKDLLPSDSILLKMLLEAKEYFSTTNHHWCTYDIDQSLLFSAEHKDGIHYSFGELRTIKDSDLNTIKDNNFNTPRKEDDNNENVLW